MSRGARPLQPVIHILQLLQHTLLMRLPWAPGDPLRGSLSRVASTWDPTSTPANPQGANWSAKLLASCVPARRYCLPMPEPSGWESAR